MLQNLDDTSRNTVRTLAVSLGDLGQIQLERQQADCVASFEESLAIAEAINDRAVVATCAFRLGHAHWGISVPTLRDLDQAEHWYRRSLDLQEDKDRLGRARCLGQIGAVARQRYNDSRRAKVPASELLVHLNAALQSYHQDIELLPADAVNDLAAAHSQLGNTYGDAGDLDLALHHYREAIRHRETSGDVYTASQIRFNVAVFLAHANRLSDAREYVRASLRGFETFGASAAARIAETQQLLAAIEQAIQKKES